MRRPVPASAVSPADLFPVGLPAPSVYFSALPVGRSKCESNHQLAFLLPPATKNEARAVAGFLLLSLRAVLQQAFLQQPGFLFPEMERERVLPALVVFLFFPLPTF